MGKRLRQLKEEFTLIEIMEKDFVFKTPKDYCIMGDIIKEDEIVIKFPFFNKALDIDTTVSIYAYLNDNEATLECYTYDSSDYEFSYLFKVNLERDITTIDGLEFPYLMEKITRDMAKSFTKIVFEAMAYVEYRMREQKTVFKTLKKKNSTVAKGQSSNTIKAPTKRVEVIGESKTVYLQIDGSKDFIKSARSYNRHIDCWEVKPHTRRLKSGAIVEVRGCIKGDSTKKPNKKKILVK